MVTVVQLHPQNSAAALGPLAEGLAAAEQALLGRALEFAEPMYAGQLLSTGEPTWSHALGLAASLASRSEEHTSELQSPCNLVCRLLLEKKKKKIKNYNNTKKTKKHKIKKKKNKKN